MSESSAITPMKILLVEANPRDVHFLSVYISQAGTSQFEVTHAETLAHALQSISAASFDIILLDLALPDAQGLSAFLQINEKAAGVPVVVLTGGLESSIGLKAVQAGAQDYLPKEELDSHVLVRAMRYAIERKRTAVQLLEANKALQVEIVERKRAEDALAIKAQELLVPMPNCLNLFMRWPMT